MITPNNRAERETEWWENHRYEEATEVVRLIIATGHWLELLTADSGAVNAAMKELFAYLIPEPAPEEYADAPWLRLWEEVGTEDVYVRALYGPAAHLSALNRFAYYGLPLDGWVAEPGSEAQDRAAAIEEIIDTYRRFADRIPSEWPEATTSSIKRTVLAAEARIRLDTGRDVTPEQLAAVAGVSLKSIRNLLTPKSGVDALRISNGLIPCTDAMRWLTARPSFRTSVWQECSPLEDQSHAPPSALGEVLFVPVARDGSWFDPLGCRGAEGFIIGPKGAEEIITDYRLALDRLSHMPVPYWRRPTPAGRAAVVVGVSWQRKILADLDLDRAA